MATVCFGLSFLTMSRTGILIIIIALITSLFRRYHDRFLLKRGLVYFFGFGFFLMFSYLGLISVNKLVFTNIENVITILVRFGYWSAAAEFFQDNPLTIFTGVSFAGYSVFDVIGFEYAESLFLDMLIHGGFFPVLMMVIIWFNMFFATRFVEESPSNLQVMMRTFGVGFLAANLFAGSPFLTDFLMPVVLIVIIKFREKRHN